MINTIKNHIMYKNTWLKSWFNIKLVWIGFLKKYCLDVVEKLILKRAFTETLASTILENPSVYVTKRVSQTTCVPDNSTF